jgi:ABC-2 type transport system permease protein
MDPAFLQDLLTDKSGFMNLISQIFPSTRFLGLALVNTDNSIGIVNILIFAGYSLLAVALAWLIGEKLYFKGLVGSSEITARRQTLSNSDYKRLGRSLPAILSYWKKEMRILIRTPTYFMNSVMTNLLAPVLVTVPFLIQAHNQKGPMPWEKFIARPEGQTILMVVIIGIIVFLAASNAIAATSLSREGKQFFISKYIPLPYLEQIQAKLLSAYVFGICGTVLMIIAARILMPLESVIIGMLLGVGMVAIIPVIEAGLLIDILQPKLQWENEQQAFKQNLNVIFSMLAAILLGGIILYIVVRFIHSPVWAAMFMLICFGLSALVLYYLLITWGIEQYHKLEG